MFRRIINKKLLGFFIALATLLPVFYAAAADPLPGIKDFTIDKLGNMITGIACWTIQIVLAIMVIALVVAGIRFFLARGEPTATGVAKKNLTWVLVGIAVILGTNIIIATIANSLGSNYKYVPLDCGPNVDVNLIYGGGEINTYCDNNNPCKINLTCQNNLCVPE